MFDDSLLIVSPGVNATTSATSAPFALPNTQAGTPARVVRVASTQAAYINFGTSAAVTATASNILTQPADAVVLTLPRGTTHFAVIQDAASGKVNVQAIEY